MDVSSSENKQLLSEKSNLESEIKQHQDYLQIAQQLGTNLQQKNVELVHDNEDHREKISQLVHENNSLKKRLAEIQDLSTKTNEENQHLLSETKSLKCLLFDMQEREKNSEKIRSENNHLVSEIESKKKEIDELRSQNESLVEFQRKLAAQLGEMKDGVTQAKMQMEQYQTQVDTLEIQYVTFTLSLLENSFLFTFFFPFPSPSHFPSPFTFPFPSPSLSHFFPLAFSNT